MQQRGFHEALPLLKELLKNGEATLGVEHMALINHLGNSAFDLELNSMFQGGNGSFCGYALLQRLAFIYVLFSHTIALFFKTKRS